MLRFITRRLLHGVPIVFGIAIMNFLLLQLAPGDAASVLAGESGGAPAQYLEQLRIQYGLDEPVFIQLLLYVKNILSLNLGYSFRYNMPVLHLILERMGPTLLLMGGAFFLSLIAGVLMGIMAAVAVHGWRDQIVSRLFWFFQYGWNGCLPQAWRMLLLFTKDGHVYLILLGI